MPDSTGDPIGDAISALAGETAIAKIKAAAAAGQKAAKRFAQDKLTPELAEANRELSKQISELEDHGLALARALRESQREIDDLNERLRVRAELEFESPFRVKKDDIGKIVRYCCPACYVNRDKDVDILQYKANWQCPSCEKEYPNPNRRPYNPNTVLRDDF